VATTETREVRAQAKWVRTSARKARLVAEHIRGRSVPEARAVLAFTPRAAAREMEKVLKSAVANAEANHGLYGEELIVSSAYVDEGPTLKRWRARARGRVARIRKRTCHITVTLAPAPGATTTARGRRGAAETAEKPKRRPSVRKPRGGDTLVPDTPAEPKPEAETAAAAEADAPEAPVTTEEKPKPKRRTPVRRKKTEETES
jgi:ribosomal protein L22